MDLIPTLPTYVTDVASQSVWGWFERRLNGEGGSRSLLANGADPNRRSARHRIGELLPWNLDTDGEL